MYAARLARALRERVDVEIFGMGGAQMRGAGVDVVTDYSEVAVLGITEILSHLPSLVRAMRRLVGETKRRKPTLAILTDFPGFHLRLARKVKPFGVRNVYYICPQFWAWRPWRVRVVRRRFELGLCIFPFEEKFYGDAGVPMKFIGHPLVGNVTATLTRDEFCAKHGLDPKLRIVTLLPGSRWGEVARHLPTLLAACQKIEDEMPGQVQFVLAMAVGAEETRLRGLLPPRVRPAVVTGETYNALAAADAAAVCSGTATVEAALLDVPMVVVYRVTPLTALLAKPLVRTKYFAMVNLIVGKEVVPELIQKDFEPGRVAAELTHYLQSPEAVAEVRAGLAEVRRRLGPAGAVERAADAIAALLADGKSNAK